MKNLFRPLLVLTGCIVLANCISQKQSEGLKTDYTKLQTEYQESQLQLRENQTRPINLEGRLAETQRNNSELRKSLSDMQNILSKSFTQSSQGNMNMDKLIDEINASNRFIQHLVKEKNRSDSLNLVMVNKLTRSLTHEEMRDLSIEILKGVVCTSLADSMLYKSGSCEINDKAGIVLNKIAKITQDYKGYDVLIEGNIDTGPVSHTNICNNWDLSTLRASSVVQALQNIYGMSPKRLTAIGQGEFDPVADNDMTGGKARSRRAEIIITPRLNQFMDSIDQAPDNFLSGIIGDEDTKEQKKYFHLGLIIK